MLHSLRRKSEKGKRQTLQATLLPLLVNNRAFHHPGGATVHWHVCNRFPQKAKLISCTTSHREYGFRISAVEVLNRAVGPLFLRLSEPVIPAITPHLQPPNLRSYIVIVHTGMKGT